MKNREDYDKNAYYIFLVKKSEKGNKNGIMPFNRHFGFMFMENGQQPSQQLISNSQKLYHTIAHELGHSLSRKQSVGSALPCATPYLL